MVAQASPDLPVPVAEGEAELDEIQRALAAPRWLAPMPACLKAGYAAERLAGHRSFNRWAVVSFTFTFDLFWLAQFKSAPELVPLSGLLRLGLLTPCVALFVLLDRRNRLGRLYEPALFLLALAPGLISAFLCLLTTSATTLSDIRSTPLILLCTGLVWRMALPGMIANAVLSGIVFAAGIIASPCVPRDELFSIILMDWSIATTVITFNLQLERRDRRMFLLTMTERIHRAILATLNRGLLAETQTDALTGVANRRGFDETLEATWRGCMLSGECVSLIMFDLDHFKAFNDHYGHQGGDDCLRAVAGRARAHVRAGNLIARYGGEEFAVILPGATLAAAAQVAERIRTAVADLAMLHAGIGPRALVSVSLGVAGMVPREPDGVRRLIEAADSELYAAKRNGRDRVCAAREEVLF